MAPLSISLNDFRKNFKFPQTAFPSQNKDGIYKGAVYRVPVSSLPKNMPWLKPKIDVERKPLPKGIVGIPELSNPPHHRINPKYINIAKIPRWLHSHPFSVHFDKSEVLPHHRLIGGNPATWTPQNPKKQPRTLIGGNPSTWSPKNQPKPQQVKYDPKKQQVKYFPKK